MGHGSSRYLAIVIFLILGLSSSQYCIANTFKASFPSMGTIFVIQGSHHGSVLSAKLASRIVSILESVDLTFSDWNERSTLRQLERNGLTNWQHTSKLFMHGLLLAQKLHKQSKGLFDITVGVRLAFGNKHGNSILVTNPVGLDQMEIAPDKLSFRFRQDPKRLTFNGFIKGYAVGLLAQILYRAGFSTFSVDGGGGDQAIFAHGSVLFQSYSGSAVAQNQQQLHVFSPKGNVTDPCPGCFSHHKISSSAANLEDWPEIAATCDAIATTKLLKLAHQTPCKPFQ